MYINCITSTPISNNEKVKLMFVFPKKDKYYQGLMIENDFKIIGLPFDGIYDEKMRCHVDEDNINYKRSFNYLLKNNGDTFKDIQQKIFNGKVKFSQKNSLNKKEVFVNLMAIKESIYNSILTDELIKLKQENGELNFKDYYKNKIEEYNILLNLKSKADDSINENEKQKYLIEFGIKISEFNKDVKKISTEPCDFNDFKIKDYFDDIIKMSFVINVLEDQGYFIIPTQEHMEGNRKSDFLKKLLNIQENKEKEEFIDFKETRIE